MSLKRIPIKTLADVEQALEDIRNNLSMDDIKPGQLRTTTPTTETLDKGRRRTVEEAGIPVEYMRATDGTLYKLAWTLA